MEQESQNAERKAPETVRSYAILPAAGRSRRMGQSKLLLDWPTERRPEGCVMDQVLEAWTSSMVHEVVVVLRRDDPSLSDVCRKWPVHLVRPEIAPVDMKASLSCGLDFIRTKWSPDPLDRVLFAPSDLPTLSTTVIDAMCRCAAVEQKIIVPHFDGKRGHPISIPWCLTKQTQHIPEDRGLDELLERVGYLEHQFPRRLKPEDMDTPEAYQDALDAFRRPSDPA